MSMLNNLNSLNNRKPNVKFIFAILSLALLIGFFAFQNSRKPENSQVAGLSTNDVQTPILASVNVNKTLKFPIPASSTGAKIDESIKFTIVTAERKDQIKVQGRSIRAPEGKDYLLLRLEIDNPSSERIKFMSSDFIRLVGSEDKRYSPDYHNGIITLDPISVKKDLMAFVIDEKLKKLTFQVGELSKDKETLEIQFK